mmetsp:Transcript_28492/g.58320  ORF Transcript_28492/g.58320 Transcript_28492/m.58320 type:complete len:252 (+) Transcript_28492:535-1290(+)
MMTPHGLSSGRTGRYRWSGSKEHTSAWALVMRAGLGTRKEVGSGSRRFLVFFSSLASPSLASPSFASTSMLSPPSSLSSFLPSSTSTSIPPSASSFAFFLASRALFLAVVERATVSTLFFFSSFFSSSRLGYANWEGLESQRISKDLGYLKSLLSPMVYVGVSAALSMCIIGNQCQCCNQSTHPAALVIFVNPFRLPRSSAQFRPPASMRPVDSIAPIFVKVDWCFSPTMDPRRSRKALMRRPLQASDCCM